MRTTTMRAIANTNLKKKLSVVETLDLHGKTREQALRSMAYFLSDATRRYQKRLHKGIWVEIVTGSGAHSPQGPVLRKAIQTTLERRQMVYQIHSPGKASFLVLVGSGYELRPPPSKVDTKLQFQSLPGPRLVPSAAGGSWRNYFHNVAEAASYTSDPRPCDVAEHVARARQKAMADKRQEAEEVAQLNRVLADSALEEETKVKEEDRLLKEALAASAMQMEQEQEKEKECLDLGMSESLTMKRVLSESAVEEETKAQEEELQLRDALAASALQMQQEKNEEEARLHLAISASLATTDGEVEDCWRSERRSSLSSPFSVEWRNSVKDGNSDRLVSERSVGILPVATLRSFRADVAFDPPDPTPQIAIP